MSDLHIDASSVVVGEYEFVKNVLISELVSIVEGVGEEIRGIFVVGDISKDMRLSLAFMDQLRDVEFLVDGKVVRYPVYFVPGNHDLRYVRDGDIRYSSDEVLGMYVDSEYNLIGKPVIDGDVGIVGGMSWYDYSLSPLSDEGLCDVEIEDRLFVMSSSYVAHDFTLGTVEISEYFTKRLEEDIRQVCDAGVNSVVVLNHFVPHVSFVDVPSTERGKVLNGSMGVARLHEIFSSVVVEYGVDLVNVFGHTHTEHEGLLDGVSYVCKPYGYIFAFAEEEDYGIGVMRDRLREMVSVIDLGESVLGNERIVG